MASSISEVESTHSSLDGDMSEDDLFGDISNHKQDPKSLVCEFILRFSKEDKKEVLEKKLDELGVENLSHLEVINLQESFQGILKPVQIALLAKELREIGADTVKEASSNSKEIIDFSKVFNQNQLRLLGMDHKLDRLEITAVVKSIGDHIHLNSSKTSKNLCERVAKLLISTYKSSLGPSQNQSLKNHQIKMGHQILNRVRYLKKLDKKKKARAVKRQSLVALNLQTFSKRQCYGIQVDRDLPLEFPKNETKDSQEQKRLEMIKMHKSGEVNWSKVKKYMVDTHVAQRLTLHCLKRLDLVLNEWPFFGKFCIMRPHFMELMGLDREEVENRIETFCPKFLKFLEYESYEKDKRKSVTAQNIRRQLKNIVKRQQKDADSARLAFLAVILGAAAKMNVNLDGLFLYFDETTSRDEIEASENLPTNAKPIVAVLGKDVMEAKSCFVLVDKRTTYHQPTDLIKGIHLAFMAYFVFKVTYPKELYPLFVFMEREIYGIEGEENSSRCERVVKPNGKMPMNPPPQPAKYVTLMSNFYEFEEQL